MHRASVDNPERLSRRDALARGALGAVGLCVAGLLSTGCASSNKQTSGLPDPLWPDSPRTRPDLVRARPAPATPTATPVAPIRGVIPRASWADGHPVPTLMDRMLPVRRITLHHDGMTPFTSTSRGDAAARLEAIRRAHRSHNWGDIGYHYVVDPAGRVWEGRPLTYQGAHVRDQNEGNLGVCVLGNYERQYPNAAQLDTLENFVTELMRRYRVGVRDIHTHRELAPTKCPGRHLQPRFVAMRGMGGALASV